MKDRNKQLYRNVKGPLRNVCGLVETDSVFLETCTVLSDAYAPLRYWEDCSVSVKHGLGGQFRDRRYIQPITLMLTASNVLATAEYRMTHAVLMSYPECTTEWRMLFWCPSLSAIPNGVHCSDFMLETIKVNQNLHIFLRWTTLVAGILIFASSSVFLNAMWPENKTPWSTECFNQGV